MMRRADKKTYLTPSDLLVGITGFRSEGKRKTLIEEKKLRSDTAVKVGT